MELGVSSNISKGSWGARYLSSRTKPAIRLPGRVLTAEAPPGKPVRRLSRILTFLNFH